ncbi:MAG: TonB-dependent receptor [Tenuifilaceae bacterium]|nr:TonB-dependent receptor [Tenuifilaceae bacterium]
MKITSSLIVCTLCTLLISLSTLGQYRISGFVRDSLTHEVLVGAHIIDSTKMRVVATDNNGYFSINAKPGNSLTVSFVGYKSKYFFAKPKGDTLVQLLLTPSNEIDEVVIKHTKRHTHSISTLSNVELQQIPSLGAKPDVMKAIQLLPGIQSQNEGSSTVLVRGGNPGENLYLFDNVALIYVNHLGGFTSVFNPDIINNINVYKGGFPAAYGGKLSSIIDIAQREGNVNNIKGSYSIGITDASFAAEGPTPIKHTTFIVTGRKTLIDPVMALASHLSGGGDNLVSYGFHDINGKFTWRPNARNTFSFNLYQGDDYLNYWYSEKSLSGSEKARLANIWGNWLLSTRWNRVHNPRLYSTQSLSFVRYRLNNFQNYSNTDTNEKFSFEKDYRSSVQDLSYKWDFKADLFKSWRLDFGIHSSYLRFSPNRIYISNHTGLKNENPINAFESAIYAENTWEIPKILNFRLGARVVNYFTKNYNAFRVEPRANIDISLSPDQSLNIGYMKTNQFSHLLFTQGEIMSSEVWVPADNTISPASTQQISGGWRGVLANGMFDVEVGGYYKTLENISTYAEGYKSLMGDGSWRAKVESGGEGKAYGAEVFIRKNQGKWTGFLGYSWSKAYRKYNGINNGIEYLFEFDRPHSLTLNVNRKLNQNLTLSASWVFHSGLPFTPVIGRQSVPSHINLNDGEPFYYEAFIYGDKNSARMRNYHRLDVAMHYSTYTRNGNRAQWTLAVYNAYNRSNPFSYIYTHDTSMEGLVPTPFFNGRQTYEPFSLYQVSFFPIIPTLSYKVFFGEGKPSNFKPREKRSLLQKLLYH